MKKIVIFTVITCLLGSLSAQRIPFVQGDKSHKKAYLPQQIRIVDGTTDGQYLVVEPDLNAFHKTKAVKVRWCDINWKDSKTALIPETKSYNIKDAFCSGNKLHLLLDYEDWSYLKLRHVELDAKSLDILSDNMIVDINYTAAQRGDVMVASSPNGERHGAVLTLWSDNGGNYVASAKAFLFDKDMKQLWQRDLAATNVHQILVTDRGEVVTAAIGAYSENKEESVFLFNLADANGALAAEMNTKADVDCFALLNYNDGKVVLTALEGKGNANRVSVGLGYASCDRKYSGICSYCFYIPTSRMVSEQRHRFTLDDVRCFENRDADERVDSVADLLSIDDYCATPQGGAVIYHRAWKMEVRDMRTGSQGGSTAYSLGMLLAMVDMDGNITAVVPIRQNNQNADSPNVGADVFPHNGKVYVVTNESEEETDEYTPNVPAMRHKKLLKANTGLSIYAISPNGEVKKQMLEKERRALLKNPLCKGKDGIFYFLSGGVHSNISYIKLP